MTTIEEVQAGEDAKEIEMMKSLTLGVVGDLARLLREQGLGRKPARILEALVFAMFFITEAYLSARKGDLKGSTPALDRYHDAMTEYVFEEVFFKQQKAKDREEVEERFNQLSGLINERYEEYRRGFVEDYRRRDRSFESTLNAFLGHLFPEPLTDPEEKTALFLPLSRQLVHFWTGCLMSFRSPNLEMSQPAEGPR